MMFLDLRVPPCVCIYSVSCVDEFRVQRELFSLYVDHVMTMPMPMPATADVWSWSCMASSRLFHAQGIWDETRQLNVAIPACRDSLTTLCR